MTTKMHRSHSDVIGALLVNYCGKCGKPLRTLLCRLGEGISVTSTVSAVSGCCGADTPSMLIPAYKKVPASIPAMFPLAPDDQGALPLDAEPSPSPGGSRG